MAKLSAVMFLGLLVIDIGAVLVLFNTQHSLGGIDTVTNMASRALSFTECKPLC